jgi:hypothetical protein
MILVTHLLCDLRAEVTAGAGVVVEMDEQRLFRPKLDRVAGAGRAEASRRR